MRVVSRPWLADDFLAILVPAGRFESLSGDLLEQYRDEKVPALGHRRAGLWYWRQVAGHFMRLSWPFLALLLATFVIRDLYNTFLNSDAVTNARMERIFTWVLFPSMFAAGLHGGRTTGRTAGGALVAVGTQVLAIAGLALWTVATFRAFLPVLEHRAWWIAAWHYSGNGESFRQWLIEDNIGALVLAGPLTTIAAAILGTLGGAVGMGLRRRDQRSRSR